MVETSITTAAVRCSAPRKPKTFSPSNSGLVHQASGYFSANPVTTNVGKLRMMPQCAMRKLRFIRITFPPVSCRGCRRISFARKSIRLCSTMKPSVKGMSSQYVQRIHFDEDFFRLVELKIWFESFLGEERLFLQRREIRLFVDHWTGMSL